MGNVNPVSVFFKKEGSSLKNCFECIGFYDNFINIFRSCLNFFQKYYLHCPQEVLVFLCPLLHEPTPARQSKCTFFALAYPWLCCTNPLPLGKASALSLLSLTRGFVARTHSRSAKQVNFLCSRLPVALLPVFPFFAVT